MEMAGDSLKATFDPSSGDSINPWLQQQMAHFRTLLGPARKDAIDSLCHRYPHDIRCGLLLRDQIEMLKDSIFVRRCLGGLADDAKPDWLMSLDPVAVLLLLLCRPTVQPSILALHAAIT